MSEHLHPPSEPKKLKPESGLTERYPTDQELREFEALVAFERTLSIEHHTIEEFARDPENPTEAEIKAVEDLNDYYRPTPTSFEEYFGYPDPREATRQGRDDPSKS